MSAFTVEQPVAIERLDETVINRIAAGEVIQRPANALKEMIENSLDAKATNIQILAKNGGLKLLQIQDNGTGIRKQDFPIVCERFTTSKLRNFEDLQSISTYGFRGEALASISHVAHLTITSKTSNEICAYKANFVDGKLKGALLPIAGNQGTIITVEDLFYNMNVRRRALRSPAEEYQKISEVVGKYAIHNAQVGFALKKSQENFHDIHTPPDSNPVDNIRTVYGNSIARELIEFDVSNQVLKFKASGHMTNVNYSTKKFNFLLFINHRLVDCQSLKKGVDQIYSTYLPKHCHPFVYMSLELDPNNVDVNVHPTKHQVNFLNEEQITEAICTHLETKLLGSNNSRMYFVQAKLPGASAVDPLPLKDSDHPANKSKTVVQHAKDLVRTDAGAQKIDKFFGSTPQRRQKNDEEEAVASCSFFTAAGDHGSTEEPPEKTAKIERKDSQKQLCPMVLSKTTRIDTELTSILQLRKSLEDNCHRTLRDIFAQHVFVGSVDPSQSLIQYSTKLFLCHTKKIMRELFYQLVLTNFQNLGYIKFAHPLPIHELALQGLDQPEVGWTPEDGAKTELAEKIRQILCEKREMLNEYFSLEIDQEGNLKSIPLILDDHVPELAGLPLYVVRLATEVVWDSEKECFDTFAQETALYYCDNDMEEEISRENSKDWRWITEHVLYAAVKEYFLPPKKFTTAECAAVLEIADLPKLYKVFERC